MKRRLWTALVVVLAGATAAVAAIGFDPSGETADEGADRPLATVPVTRQTLVDTQSESGELTYGDAVTLPARIAGTVTGLAAVGTVIQRGQALFRIDDDPIVLLYGTMPAYRALSSGLSGTDVTQLETNLAALGYTGFTVDDTYTGATASAVREWQEDLGFDETGTVELGRVVFSAGPVRIDARSVSVGESVQPGGAVLTGSGTGRVVTVGLEVGDARLATVGSAVTVTLPGGTSVAATITSAEAVVESSGADGESETTLDVTVTITDQAAVKGLDRAAVRVAFAASKRENVLTVPVAALLALAEGGYGVQVVDGTSMRVLAVETGLFAGGRVEVSGGGLAEGMTVGVPSCRSLSLNWKP